MADSMEVQKFEYVTCRVYGRAQVLEIELTQVTAWDECGTADGVAVFRDTARGITGKCTNLFFMFKGDTDSEAVGRVVLARYDAGEYVNT